MLQTTSSVNMAAVREVVATGFLIFRRLQGNIEFLLMHASYEKGLWTPPKGHVEPGESELETAYREVEEESGLKKSHLKILEGFQKTLRYQAHGKPKRVEYWIAELLDPKTPIILSHEHVDYKWLTFGDDNSKTLLKYPDMMQAYEEALDFIINRN